MTLKLRQGDARHLPWIKDGSISCIVTSPPYWALRSNAEDYGVDLDSAEIGIGTLDEYIKSTVEYGREMWRVLRDDGLFWLNLGDTAAGSGGAGGDHNKGGSKSTVAKYRQKASGLPRMNQCLVPQRVAIALQADGWIVRRMITWDKGQVKPADIAHDRKPLSASEQIIMLAKSPTHRYFHEAHSIHGIELGDVWHIPPHRGERKGPPPFPIELPFRCIVLSTMSGETVLDPFAGSFQTMEAARALKRNFVGVDLYYDK